MMRPRSTAVGEVGLLEYLEDIIGTNAYVLPLEELSQKIEVLNGEKNEKLNRLKIVEKEKDALEHPKNEALLFQQKNHQVNVEKCKLFQLYKHQCEQNEQETTQLTQELKEKIKAEQDKLKDKVTELNELEQQFEQAKQAHDVRQTALVKAKRQKEKYKYIQTYKHTNIWIAV